MSSPTAFHSLLVPYDGSDPARRALALALSLIGPDTTLTVLTVVNEAPIMAESATTVMAYDPTPLFEELDAQGRALIADAVARCDLAKVTPVTEIVHDMPVAGILNAAKAHASDLIVMGTHARTGLARAFIGSTTEGVLRLSDVPVLTTLAGDQPSAQPFATLLVAIDDSDASDAGVAVAARLRMALGVHLVACHVSDTSRLYDNAVTYGFSPGPIEADVERESAAIVTHALQHADIPVADVELALVDGRPTPAILAAAAEHHASAIVVGSHGRRGLRRFILGSVAEEIVRESPVPVLVVRQNAPRSVAGSVVQDGRGDLIAGLAQERL
jgi:nucleotide-binding universal stress UspA family protein